MDTDRKYQALMLDMETLSTKPNAVVLQIAALPFDPATGDYGEAVSVNLAIQPQLDAGLVVDASTLLWWNAQTPEARHSVFEGIRHDPEFALLRISDRMAWTTIPEREIWCHVAADYIWLESLRRTFASGDKLLERQMNYRRFRDVRTLKEFYRGLAPKVQAFDAPPGTRHTALGDCYKQVQEVHYYTSNLRVAAEEAGDAVHSAN